MASPAKLDKEQISSLIYHDLFDYPLTEKELDDWKLKKGLGKKTKRVQIQKKKNYFFLKGKSQLVEKRLQREKISQRKIKIAKKAARILKKIPTIKMVAVTGSLAMKNATKESDIDLLIVTQKGLLWSTRLIVYPTLLLAGIKVRRVGKGEQENKLCLNMWFDEGDLNWKKARNIYTAHEIAQIIPLVIRANAYQKFLVTNSWINDYWPNVSKSRKSYFRKTEDQESIYFPFSLLKVFEPLAFQLQFLYMRKKMTREVATRTRAVFHPINWSRKVSSGLDTLEQVGLK